MRQVLTLNSLNNQAIYEKCRKILLLTSNNHYKMWQIMSLSYKLLQLFTKFVILSRKNFIDIAKAV